MKIYLVGGALRDEFLGLEIHDRDFVVTGASVQDLKKLGFIQVGKSFPVFLHPETSEEYALARKEINTGDGYQDFSFDFNPSISLKEDLIRRDFTVNALARGDDGKVHDYFGGIDDLNNKIIRHISKHFSEDPLRVLRGLRFSSNLGFGFAEETEKMMTEMIEQNMLIHLSKDRIYKEMMKVNKFKTFFDLSQKFGIKEFLFPGISSKVNIQTLSELVSYRENDDILKLYPFEKKFINLHLSFTKLKNNFSHDLNSFFELFEVSRRSIDKLKSLISLLRLHGLLKVSDEEIIDVYEGYSKIKFNSQLSINEIQNLKIEFIQNGPLVNKI